MAIAKQIIPINIEEEMKASYLDYAMSVIIGRALPDVRDGLKPVHRRILYSMYEEGMTNDKPTSKSAGPVGDVLKKYHPHGDMAVYDAIVRLVQDFNSRYPLLEGQGNFGSIDGDSAAAYRYTEVRLSRLSMALLSDMDKETVDFSPSYDEKRKEPSVLPSGLPCLLMNGSSGIAVGMATNIPPQNLGELIDGITALIEEPSITVKELMQHIKGPDFPTGGLILGVKGIESAYETGRGVITLQARAVIEEMDNGRAAIIVTELPYQVNKARLIENIANLTRDKRLDGISDLRDESDRNGMRVVIELKRDANPHVVLNQLYKRTNLRTSFGVIMLALVNGRPQILSLKQMLEHYLEHRKQVVTRRTQFDLDKAQARAHILEGLRIAVANLDEVVRIIRASKNSDEARTKLMTRFELSQLQAQAILDMRLHQLTALEQDKIEAEYRELLKLISYLQDLLESPRKIAFVIRDELLEAKKTFADARRSQIKPTEASELTAEDLIAEEEMIITITRDGYIKRLPSVTYHSQGRGGKGIIALTTREEDSVAHLFVATTHHHLLFFTDKGKVYRLKAYEVPMASRQARGTAIINLIQIEPGEKVTATVAVKDLREEGYLFMATRKGVVKKTPLVAFNTPRKGGLIAITIKEGDDLCWVASTNGEQDIILASSKGLSIRFHEADVRSMG
ncbi:MAG: DNA gyrase subunit A, partial [bacterium]